MWHVLGCCQGSTDLCGMMCIVVYDGDAADLTFFLETAVSSAKGFQALFHGFYWNIKKVCECHGCNGLVDIVNAGHPQRYPS